MQGGEVLRTDARTFLKLYVHGILFSLLSTVLSLGWVFVAAFLIRFGFLVGLAIAIGLLVLLARVRERDGESPALVSRQRRLVGVLPTGVDHECRGRARPPADRGRFVPLFPGWRIGGGIPWVADIFRLPAPRRRVAPTTLWSPDFPVSSTRSPPETFQRHVVCPTCGTGYDFVSDSITRCPKDGTPLRGSSPAG